MTTVSVVVPTYNRATVLRRAIESVLDQTFQDFEVVIADDGSTDNTPSVVESFSDERIHYLRFSENQGANAVRKAGIKATNGDYIAFLDSDDKWKPEKLERQVKKFNQLSSDYGLVYTGIIQKDSDGNVTSKALPKHEGDVLGNLTKGNFIGTFSSIMVRSVVMRNISLNIELPSWQDWHFYLNVAEDWKIAGISEYLVVKYSDRIDRISNDFDDKFDVSYPILRNKLQNLDLNKGFINSRQVDSSLNFRLGYNALINQRYSKARYLFAKSIIKYPMQTRGWIYFLVSLGGHRVYKGLQTIKRMITTQSNQELRS